jgi:predicted nucleic acid-binding protein
MAANVLVDASFLVALINRRDTNHAWASAQALTFQRPWKTCEPALSEAFYNLGPPGSPRLIELLRRRAVISGFQLNENLDDIIALLRKYADLPISLADACLVRMSEILSDPILLTTDSDFRVYRRHGRQVVPCVMPR